MINTNSQVSMVGVEDPSVLERFRIHPVASEEAAEKEAIKNLTRDKGRSMTVLLRKISDGSLWIQHKWDQPCWGDIGWYMRNHGDSGGYPNRYRPSDLKFPMPDPALFLPVRLYARRQNCNDCTPANRGWLRSKNNPWRHGLSNARLIRGGDKDSILIVTDADVNLTVLINFLVNVSPNKGLVWSTAYKPIYHNEQWRTVVSVRNEPKLYFPEKTWAEGGNYYRGGIRKIWAPGGLDTNLNMDT